MGGKSLVQKPLTLTLLAVSFVARFADAVEGLGRVLAQGVDVAIIRALRTLVHICTSKRERSWSRFLYLYLTVKAQCDQQVQRIPVQSLYTL